MKKSLSLLLFVLTATTFALASASPPSSPPPSSGGNSGGSSGDSARSSRNEPPELSFYNDGTTMLFKKDWAGAQKQLEAAVAINPKNAEAHNNLAYVLRKQGPQNYEKSLAHYSTAIELKPKLAEPYMYRGALHVLMGKPTLAAADYDTLVKMKSKLAPALKKIMETGKEEEPEQFYGVTKKAK
jgi:tetratricopeptide (TPR) repeat protein